MNPNILEIGKNFLIQYLYTNGGTNIAPNTFRQVVEFQNMNETLILTYVKKIVSDLEKTKQIEIYNKSKSLNNNGIYFVRLTKEKKDSILNDTLPKKNKILIFFEKYSKILATFIALATLVLGILTYLCK